MKFIHTADLHLDSPFLGLKNTPDKLRILIIHSTFKALERLVDDAIREKVDFIVIAGDIYDRDDHSIQAERFFTQQCNRLNEAQINVYLSYGNHDYQRVDNANSNLPNNVYVFGNQVETKEFTTNDGTSVSISGFSYDSRWILEDRTVDYPSRSLVDVKIGLLHGMLTGLTTTHDNYAPFNLAELRAKNYDYWALGHIHKREVIAEQPWVIYPGNTQGRHINEQGDKGYYLVERIQGKLTPTFKSVQPIIWTTLDLQFNEIDTTTMFLAQIMKNIESLDVENPRLIQISIHGSLTSDLEEQIDNGTILADIQDKLISLNMFSMWPIKVRFDNTVTVPQLTELDQAYWDQAAQQVFTQDNLNQLGTKLFEHKFIREYFQNTRVLDDLKQEILIELGGVTDDH